LGLHAQDVLAGARWMNAGTCQLIVPLSNAQALTRVRPQLQALQDVAVAFNRLNVYVWHQSGTHIGARYFFDNMGSVVEDPGTGSACANLGAWAHLNGHAPLNWQITQAQAINRPNHLYLNVMADGGIEVGGKVMAFARGEMVV
jgi:PhzF family phenazine biosynthesis protein